MPICSACNCTAPCIHTHYCLVANRVLMLSGLLCWSCSITLQTVPSRAQSTNAMLSLLVLQIDALQHSLTAEQPGWLGFCHNDLQYGNMLLAAHTTSLQPKSLLPAEDNVTQGLGREDALQMQTRTWKRRRSLTTRLMMAEACPQSRSAQPKQYVGSYWSLPVPFITNVGST